MSRGHVGKLGADEVAKRLAQVCSQRERGVLTDDEFADEIADVTHHADDPAAMRADIALERGEPVELVSLAYVRGGDRERERLHVLAHSWLEAILCPGGSGLWSSAVYYLAESVLTTTGRLPEVVRTYLATEGALTASARLAFTDAVLSGDDVAAGRLAAADSAAGCTALLALRIVQLAEEGHTESIPSLVGLADLDALVAAEAWGDVAAVASALTSASLVELALHWSGSIDDSRLHTAQEDEWSRPAGTGTSHEGHNTARSELNVCLEDDARLFGPLAVVDYLCGDRPRAGERAARVNRGWDRQGWGSAVHEPMGAWVLARLEPDLAARRVLLEAIEEPKHTGFGLLRAQIDADLAEIADAEGRPDDAHELRRRVAGVLTAGTRAHHFSVVPFGFNHLLSALPVRSGRAACEGEPGQEQERDDESDGGHRAAQPL